MKNSELYTFLLKNKNLVNNINSYYKLGVPSNRCYSKMLGIILAFIFMYILYYCYCTYSKNGITVSEDTQSKPQKTMEKCNTTCKIPVKESEIRDDLVSENDNDDDILSDIEY